MLFILFDIEVVFLYPVAVQLKAFGVVRARARRSCSSCCCSWRSSSSGEEERSNGSDPLEAASERPARSASCARGRCCAASSRATTSSSTSRSACCSRTLEKAQNWARANALFPLGFGLACCAIEMITDDRLAAQRPRRASAPRSIRASPRQADMLILSGRVSIKMAPVIRRIYDQMLEPKWVISMGACASSAGMFNNYALVAGRRQVPAGRRLRARLPAAARGADLRDHQAAGQDQGATRTSAGASATEAEGTEERCLTRPASS